MELWDPVVFPMKRVWIGIATRLGFRKTGLKRLRQEVRACEYDDVRVLWEMLMKTDAEIARFPPVTKRVQRRRGRHVWAFFEWACRSFENPRTL